MTGLWIMAIGIGLIIAYLHRSTPFDKATGRHCESFRFGDGWLNAETLRLLEDSGVRFDLTLEPETGRTTDLAS
jgi:hypothetical protein